MVDTGESTVMKDPFELLLMSLNEPVCVKLRNGRSLRGKMVAYDEHLNMMLSDAIETIETKEGGERKVSNIFTIINLIFRLSKIYSKLSLYEGTL